MNLAQVCNGIGFILPRAINTGDTLRNEQTGERITVLQITEPDVYVTDGLIRARIETRYSNIQEMELTASDMNLIWINREDRRYPGLRYMQDISGCHTEETELKIGDKLHMKKEDGTQEEVILADIPSQDDPCPAVLLLRKVHHQDESLFFFDRCHQKMLLARWSEKERLAGIPAGQCLAITEDILHYCDDSFIACCPGEFINAGMTAAKIRSCGTKATPTGWQVRYTYAVLARCMYTPKEYRRRFRGQNGLDNVPVDPECKTSEFIAALCRILDPGEETRIKHLIEKDEEKIQKDLKEQTVYQRIMDEYGVIGIKE